MVSNNVRDFAKRGDAIAVPSLTEVQRDAYRRFLQFEKQSDNRDTKLGLEALLREVFPIESYDGTMKRIYVDGILDNEIAVDAPGTAIRPTTSMLAFGARFRDENGGQQ